MAETTIGNAPLDVDGPAGIAADLLGQNGQPIDEDADAATEVGDYVANGGDDAIQGMCHTKHVTIADILKPMLN